MLGFGKLAKKVFGSPNDRVMKSTMPMVEKINALEADYQALSYKLKKGTLNSLFL